MIDGRNIHLDAGHAGRALGKRTLSVQLNSVHNIVSCGILNGM